MLLATVKTRVQRINVAENSVKMIHDMVAVEAAVRVILNGKLVATLFCLPEHLKELGVGWLFSQGIVVSIDEISSIRLSKSSVKIDCANKVEFRMRLARNTGQTDSLCGSTSEDFAFLVDRIKKPFVNSSLRIQAEELFGLVGTLGKKAKVFRQTGGTHSAALFNKGKLKAFAEDVGRHNAVDKVIGKAALERVDFSQSILASSGRQPADMVLKAARIGVPLIASVGAPLSSGIDAASKTGVTLACFVRGHRMNVYTYPERIIVPTGSSEKGSEG
jgi:FdhD protein